VFPGYRDGYALSMSGDWQGRRDVRLDTVPDPTIERPGDAIVKITSTNVCGSDLHLYETLGAFMTPGDILGHEPMGIVEEVGSEVTDLSRATGSSCRSRSPARPAGCAIVSCTPSVRPPRFATWHALDRLSVTPPREHSPP
jgi:D-arabinose 1-dehydrogenase-like Zn-dependent alcohol dehydrogenase